MVGPGKLPITFRPSSGRLVWTTGSPQPEAHLWRSSPSLIAGDNENNKFVAFIPGLA
jgi:hypothetical protein